MRKHANTQYGDAARALVHGVHGVHGVAPRREQTKAGARRDASKRRPIKKPLKPISIQISPDSRFVADTISQILAKLCRWKTNGKAAKKNLTRRRSLKQGQLRREGGAVQLIK